MNLGLRSGASSKKQSMLAGFLGAGGALDSVDGIVHGSEHPFARAKRIHRAGFDEAFEHALVQKAGLDAFTEFVERFEFTLAEARFADSLGGVLPNILDGRETEADGLANRREVEIAFVSVRRKNRNAHAPRFDDALDLPLSAS